jgi:hypothetical protein
MFWLPLILGLFAGGTVGGALGSTTGSGGNLGSLVDVDLFGKTLEEGAVEGSNDGGLGGLLGMGVGGIALLLIFMSLNSGRASQQPTIVVIDGDE